MMEHGRRVWLVRHGESTWNVRGLVQGQADGPELTAAGRAQSESVAAQLRGSAVTALYASDLWRARQTAEIIGSAWGLAVQCDPALRERCFGSREGFPLTALEEAESGIRGQRIVDIDARPHGGESLADVYRRAGRFIDWLEVQDHAGDVVVVGHGGSVRAIRAYCTGIPFGEVEWDQVPNGSVWCVQESLSAVPAKQ
jgi:probable phosphoglycerate mutase